MKKIRDNKKQIFICVLLFILLLLFNNIKSFAQEINNKDILISLKNQGKENFEENLRNEFPELFENNTYKEQGFNYFLYENTCGQTSAASALNLLFDTNYYSENKLVIWSIDNNLCDNKYYIEEDRGSQTPEQLLSTINQISSKNKNFVETKLLNMDEFLDIKEMAEFLDENGLIILNISSDILWFNKYSEPNHYILLTGYKVQNNKYIFDIIDSSGSGMTEISEDKLIDSIYGYGQFTENKMLLLKKKSFTIKIFEDNIRGRILKRKIK